MLEYAARFAGNVFIDIGTGDGAFVFRSALSDPSTLFIGIDANPRALRKISVKAERKLSKKGGVNAVFAQAAAESLPSELEGVARHIQINFPWGSLFRCVLLPDPEFLASIRKLLKPEGGRLTVVTGIDPVRDRLQLERLGLSAPDAVSLRSSVFQAYAANGFLAEGLDRLSAEEVRALGTTWSRRLASGSSREVFRLRFTAKGL